MALPVFSVDVVRGENGAFAFSDTETVATAFQRGRCVVVNLPKESTKIIDVARRSARHHLSEIARAQVDDHCVIPNDYLQLSAARYSERCQLRGVMMEPETNSREVDDADALTKVHRIFSEVISACSTALAPEITSLPHCFSSEDGILDAFYYRPPDSTAARALCPAHVDTGLFTILCDDGTPGLEVYHSDGTTAHVSAGVWIGPLRLESNQVVIMINRELETLSGGRFPAVKHRVESLQGRDRVSLSYEVRTNSFGRQLLGRIIAEDLESSEPPKISCIVM